MGGLSGPIDYIDSVSLHFHCSLFRTQVPQALPVIAHENCLIEILVRHVLSIIHLFFFGTGTERESITAVNPQFSQLDNIISYTLRVLDSGDTGRLARCVASSLEWTVRFNNKLRFYYTRCRTSRRPFYAGAATPTFLRMRSKESLRGRIEEVQNKENHEAHDEKSHRMITHRHAAAIR